MGRIANAASAPTVISSAAVRTDHRSAHPGQPCVKLLGHQKHFCKETVLRLPFLFKFLKKYLNKAAST